VAYDMRIKDRTDKPADRQTRRARKEVGKQMLTHNQQDKANKKEETKKRIIYAREDGRSKGERVRYQCTLATANKTTIPKEANPHHRFWKIKSEVARRFEEEFVRTLVRRLEVLNDLFSFVATHDERARKRGVEERKRAERGVSKIKNRQQIQHKTKK